MPVAGSGQIGLGFKSFETKYNEITLSSEQTISISQGFNLQKDKNSHLAIGYTANFVRWDLGSSAGYSGDGSDGLILGSLNTVAFDFGIIGSLRQKYRFGVAVKNLNSSALGKGISRYILPRRIDVGITYSPSSELSTSIVYENLLGKDDMQIKGAINLKLNSSLEIFTGAQSNPNRIGLGLKLKLKNNQSMSYGLLTHPILPVTHQFNLGLTL